MSSTAKKEEQRVCAKVPGMVLRRLAAAAELEGSASRWLQSPNLGDDAAA